MYGPLNPLTQLMIQLFYTFFIQKNVITDYLIPWQFTTICITYQGNRES